MEQPHTGKCHDHAVFIACINYKVVAYGTARLRHIGNAALLCPFDIIRKREKRIAAQRNSGDFRKIFLLLFLCKRFGPFRKILFPYVLAQYIFALVGKINIDDIIFIGAPDALRKMQI